MSDRTNHWRTLKYHDPRRILRELRRLEIELAGVDLDPKARRLRTIQLKQHREWRDAAIFTHGMSVLQGVRMSYATEAASDYDFVTRWVIDREAFFCPVQLKELVPADLNRRATLDQLLRGLTKYAGPTDTVAAVLLNRPGKIDLTSLTVPAIPFKQLWFFWASSPGGAEYDLYGDALATPKQITFPYPT